MKHFKIEEFDCPCCGRAYMDTGVLHMLDEARAQAGFPFIVTSGFRCSTYNKRIGGAEGSAHMRGLAADIACGDSYKRFMIITICHQLGFQRFGIGKGFVHVDADPTLPQRLIWTC